MDCVENTENLMPSEVPEKRVSWQDEMDETCSELTWKHVALGFAAGAIFYVIVYSALTFV